MTNQTCIDFYFEVVREDARVRGASVFEVLDLVVNADTDAAEPDALKASA